MPDEIHREDIAARIRKAENRQLLSLWEAGAAASGGSVAFADFNLNDLVAFRDALAVVERLDDGNWHYSYYGPDLTRLAGIDMTGKLVADLGPGAGDRIAEAYASAVGTMAPVLLTHAAIRSHVVHTWERLCLPVVGRHGTILIVQALPLVMRQDLLEAVLQSGSAAMISGAPIAGPDGALADLDILISNRAAVRLFAPDRGDLNGRLGGLLDNLGQIELMDFCSLVLTSGVPSRFEANCRIRGQESVYEISISRFDGGLTLTFSDLGELRSAYNALERQKAELVAANRTLERQKGDLAALAEEMRMARAALDEEIAQRNSLEAELRRLASVDDLTGTMNRRAFLESVHREIARSERYGNSVALAALDLDRFKQINDTWGHGVGDEVLRSVAGVLAGTIRVGVDEIGRLGGEEFAVLMPETTLDGGRIAAERMREALSEMEFEVDGRTIPISASFGVAVWQSGYETLESWMAAADAALYRAKELGRDRVEIAGANASAHPRATERAA